MGYFPCMRPRHSRMPSWFGCKFKVRWICWYSTLAIASCCACQIQLLLTFFTSEVVIGPDSFPGDLQLVMNLLIKAATLAARLRSCFFSTSCKSSLITLAWVTARTSRIVLASASDSSDGAVTGLAGHSSRLANHWGPFHQRFAPFTVPPRLARSAGFSRELTCRHSISPFD